MGGGIHNLLWARVFFHWNLRHLQTEAPLFVTAPSPCSMDILYFGAIDEPEIEISAVMRYHDISSLGFKFEKN